jgi:pimeloyl-ACP methyl ester carboxylesterase
MLETLQPIEKVANDRLIRPYRISVAEEALIDLRQRLASTRWPDEETVRDRTQGVQLATMQDLVRYWQTEYNWRTVESELNALPNFVTEIDGLDIHFIHVRSQEPNAMPLIITHGWPGSVMELLKVIGPLTDPVAYGGRAEDAFDLVLPSLPGYGFSGKPKTSGWDLVKISQAWHRLMLRLGYTKYVSQGGDWGALVSEVMAAQQLPGLIGIHINMPGTVPPNIAKALKDGDPVPDELSAEEKRAYAALSAFYTTGSGYYSIMGTRPQTLGYGLTDSPTALAAWFYDKFAAWTDSDGEPERSLTKDEMLDDITLYWLTNTGTSSARSYWEVYGGSPFNAIEISIPVGVTIFPGEIYQAPQSWAEQNYHKLVYFNEVDRGGHFAAWEQPGLFVSEVRAAFSSMR